MYEYLVLSKYHLDKLQSMNLALKLTLKIDPEWFSETFQLDETSEETIKHISKRSHWKTRTADLSVKINFLKGLICGWGLLQKHRYKTDYVCLPVCLFSAVSMTNASLWCLCNDTLAQ